MALTLHLERRDQPDETGTAGGGAIMFTPPVGEDYWEYRVAVSEGQAVIGFPKFGTIGIGFAVEEGWNTNLPFTMPAGQIYGHIAHNAGAEFDRADIIAAIELIQAAARADHPEMAPQRGGRR